jgi:hypothetical protein
MSAAEDLFGKMYGEIYSSKAMNDGCGYSSVAFGSVTPFVSSLALAHRQISTCRGQNVFGTNQV